MVSIHRPLERTWTTKGTRERETGVTGLGWLQFTFLLFNDAQFDDAGLKFAFSDCQHRATKPSAHMLTLYRFYDHWKKRKSSIGYLEPSLPFHPECRTLFGHAICAYWQAVGQVFFSLYHRSLAPHELLCGGHVKTSCFCRGSEIRLIPML